MKKSLTVAFVLAAFVLSGAAMVSAQEKEMKVTVTAGADEAKARAKEMRLTDEQRAKLAELRRECSLKGEELRADLAKLRVAMKRAMSVAEPNLAEIEGVVQKMSAVREKMQMNRIECMLQSRKILGPDWRKHGGLGCMGMSGDEGDGVMRWMGAGDDGEETYDIEIETEGEDAPGGMRVMRFRGGDERPAGMPGRKVLMLRSPEGCGGAPEACMGEAAHAGCPMMQGRHRAPMAAPRAPMKRMRVEKMRMAPGAGCGMKMEKAAGAGCGMKMMKAPGSRCGMKDVPGHVCSSSCVSTEKTCTVIVKKGDKGRACPGTCGSRAGRRSNWEGRMFRPQGKKSHSCSGACAGAESGCRIKIVKP